MELVNGYTLMKYSENKKNVLPAFNTTNFELTHGIVKGLQLSQKGGYVQISSSNLELSSPYMIKEMVDFSMKKLDVDVPIALHLDHGKSFADVKSCIDAGFTSIMVDMSHLSLSENIVEVQRITEYCHYFNIPVEAELGAIGGKEESESLSESEGKTNPNDVDEFVSLTDCDLLAVSIGNVHGLDQKPDIDFPLLQKISEIAKIPLVLHGGSGIPFEDVRHSKKFNVIKVNYGSDLRKELISTFGKAYETNHNAFDVKTLSKTGIDNVAIAVQNIMNNIN